MTDSFSYDVFLSHSSKDKVVVRPLAEHLRQDGLRVWFDEWEMKPGDSIPAKIEEGLERSRVLVLCMSANAFGSDWAQLEAGTFRFRDPLNKERRFIPLRLDETPIKGSLGQFLFIQWTAEEQEQAYSKLLEACTPPAWILEETEAAGRQVQAKAIQLDFRETILNYAFNPDGRRALTGSADKSVRLWDLGTKRCVRVFQGHTDRVCAVDWSSDQRFALSASEDKSIRLWDLKLGHCVRVFQGHVDGVNWIKWSTDQRMALSASKDRTVRLWDVETGRCVRVFEGHTRNVEAVEWSPDQRLALSASHDRTVRLWDTATGRCLRVFEGHTGAIWHVAWSSDGRFALSSGSRHDRTVQLWDIESGRRLSTFRAPVGDNSVGTSCTAWSPDGRFAISGSEGNMVRLWDVRTGRLLTVLRGHTSGIRSVTWTTDQRYAISGGWVGDVRVWDLSEFVSELHLDETSTSSLPSAPDQVQYTNAKVLLVGESGVGKTGLSRRLGLNHWQPSDSTVGAWATQWKLPVSSNAGVEREIWLWDFGGQADQRLIHQLYMDDTALAVLVFDGQKKDLFETLDEWDRDLTRASRKEFTKLLVAGRVDAGGLGVNRSDIEKFVRERGFQGFLETSAKSNIGCDELRKAILESIKWEDIPCRTTEVMFKRLKEEIIRLKDSNCVLMRFNELRDNLKLQLSGEFRFTDEDLQAVLTLLAGPGVVWELKFGSWVLFQPERINAYAQAVIRTLQADEHQRGCLMEEQVLNGELAYQSSLPRLEGDEERFVLLAMHQMLVERGLCLRQPTDQGDLLIFPSYYRRERPEQVTSPAVLVSYRFTGFLDEIYATLVVRLHHHTKAFQQDHLWRYAADFKTNLGNQLGVKLTRLAPGLGELAVYFDQAVSVQEKIIFSKYVHEHLLQHAKSVERFRHYICQHCNTRVGNVEVAMKRLNKWMQNRPPEPGVAGRLPFPDGKEETPSIVCVECEQRVPLWDELEQYFASPEVQQRVRKMHEESAIVLDNESKERALVGEVISTVALAGQISREFNVSDHGIDMEIEFKDNQSKATGHKIYLQLKSGDSHLRRRQSDGVEIFTITDERHARYWMNQPFPVLLVIRNSKGEIRWMEVRDWLLKRQGHHDNKTIKYIEFHGENFDVMSVRRWRDRMLETAGRRSH